MNGSAPPLPSHLDPRASIDRSRIGTPTARSARAHCHRTARQRPGRPATASARVAGGWRTSESTGCMCADSSTLTPPSGTCRSPRIRIWGRPATPRRRAAEPTLHLQMIDLARLLVRPGSGDWHDSGGRDGQARRDRVCPIPTARPPATGLLLWWLQHAGSWLAPGALGAALECSRAPSALSALWDIPFRA